MRVGVGGWGGWVGKREFPFSSYLLRFRELALFDDVKRIVGRINNN
jgi:hypothetical protein